MSSVYLYNQKINFDSAEKKMDEDIYQSLYEHLGSVSEQTFLDEYVKEHETKYHQKFSVNK